ncbi:MAG TPA: ABC transporter ATP-binding protein [Gemmatimonadaceae bacterium]|nr:ABC transporter ATP-binding protein [Gemmatimonadaceae bacterium]
MSYAIETRDLFYRPGKGFQISNLHMHVPRGALYGFLGPNGAGKTTTIRLLLGLLRAQRGSISVLDRSMPAEHVAVMSRTGYVPERPHVYPTLTVDEALRFHAAFHARWDHAWAATLVQQFGLVGDRKVGALSKGETGKLMMLLALAQQPELLVLDEPTDGLDPVVRRDVLEALLDYVSTHGATVLISSHLVHELERICDWIAVMDRGSMIAEVPMQEFKAGIKRLSVHNAPDQLTDVPFTVLRRMSFNGSGEQWLVRGWSDEMRAYFPARGSTLREVIDLDLEDGFVELLRSFREVK